MGEKTGFDFFKTMSTRGKNAPFLKNYEQDKTEMKIVIFVEVVTINTRNIWHEGDVSVE